MTLDLSDIIFRIVSFSCQENEFFLKLSIYNAANISAEITAMKNSLSVKTVILGELYIGQTPEYLLQ